MTMLDHLFTDIIANHIGLDKGPISARILPYSEVTQCINCYLTSERMGALPPALAAAFPAFLELSD